jgi:flagellar biosynthesis protein FlhB
MPITTPIRSEDPNKTVKPTVNAYIWLVVGLFIATFLGGVLYYILAQMNSTGITIPGNVNVLKYLFSFNNIIGLLFAMVIVVAAVALIIVYLMQTMRKTGLEE